MNGDLAASWLDRVERGEGPIYLALVRALESAVRAGELQPGDQLPPQRAVAERLGVDFTTVTRAYGAARTRGLVEGAVGRGTFVSARALEDDPGLVDLSMNLPPPPDGVSLAALLRETTTAVLQRTDPATLMAYHPGAGTVGQKAAGATWLAPNLGETAPSRVLVAPGAQAALAAAFGALTQPGDVVLAEPLTYPGVKAVAAQLGLRLLACPTDGEGPEPEGLARLCREARPKALYLVPTLQNPTADTLSSARRREIAAVAAAHDLWLVEDDPYSRLLDAPPPALAALAPQRTVHVATLSKCLSPGLRLAYLVVPAGEAGERVAEALRAIALMPSPLMAAVVTAWIREGQAEALLAGVRREARARRELAAATLPQAHGAAESIHVWLDLPQSWRPEALRQAAQARGLSLVTADAFAVGAEPRNGVRLSLGGPGRRSVLGEALGGIAALLRDGAATAKLVV